MEVFAQIFAGRLHVRKQRNIAPERFPVAQIELNAKVPRNRDQMRRTIR